MKKIQSIIGIILISIILSIPTYAGTKKARRGSDFDKNQ